MSESTVPEPSATPASETDRLEATAEALRDEQPGAAEAPVVDLGQDEPALPAEELEEDLGA